MTHEKALAKTEAIAGAAFDFNGTWMNQYGSRMELKVSGQTLAGIYESAVSSSGSAIKGQLSGFINGDLITFSVNWPTAAITSWVGQVIKDGGNDVIATLWQMAANVPDADEPTGLWQSIHAGTDRFCR
ncbi:MAG: avidin/streptavidin family protein [Reyranella sp.]|nr:avidin/streptavidin family protein [Reyranella sp.]